MSESSEQKKRLTMAFDPRARAKQLLLLIFAGLETVTAGTISVDAIQKKLFESYPEFLARFPQYDSYFAISTWLAFFSGLFFLLFPMRSGSGMDLLTVWLHPDRIVVTKQLFATIV